jgi:hypothetical protein
MQNKKLEKQATRVPEDITLETTAGRTQHPANECKTAIAEPGGRAAYEMSAHSSQDVWIPLETLAFVCPDFGGGGVSNKNCKLCAYWLRCLSLTICATIRTREPLNRFPLNFILIKVTDIGRHIPVLVKILQQ